MASSSSADSVAPRAPRPASSSTTHLSSASFSTAAFAASSADFLPFVRRSSRFSICARSANASSRLIVSMSSSGLTFFGLIGLVLVDWFC
jgi:hypothetical protein